MSIDSTSPEKTGSTAHPSDVNCLHVPLSDRQNSPSLARSQIASKANEKDVVFLDLSNPFAAIPRCGETHRSAGSEKQATSPDLLSQEFKSESKADGVADLVPGNTGELNIAIKKPIAEGEHIAFASSIEHVFTPNEEWSKTHPNGPELGHLVHVHFKAKSDHDNKMTVEIVGSQPPYAQSMSERVDLKNDKNADKDGFTTYDFDTVLPDTKQSGDLRFKFHLGREQEPGQVQIKDISAREVQSAPNANPADLTRAAEDKRIDQLRKGDLNITVRDTNGNVIPDAQVHLEEQRSQFTFGADANQLNDKNVPVPNNMVGNYEAARNWQLEHGLTKAQREEYLQKMKEMGINTVTIPIYWNQIEKNKGQPDYKGLDEMIDEAKAHHMQVKLHPIVWPDCYPEWAGQTKEQSEPLIHQHVDDIVKRYGNKVDAIEINEINSAELLTHQVKDENGQLKTEQQHNGLTDWIKQDGPASVIETVSSWARNDLAQQHSSAKLLENEYVIDQKTLASDGQVNHGQNSPDALGVQMHMFEQNWPALRIEKMLNDRGHTGRPDYVSEITVPSGNSGTEQEKQNGQVKQANELEALFRGAMSNPNAVGVSMWDFTDKNSWKNGTGGVLDENLQTKRSYETLHDLIKKQWWSSVDAQTNKAGVAGARVFKGDYQITVSDGAGHSRTIELSADRAHNDVDITL